jgi:peptide/nickel transport system substrate-binding protein
MKRLNWWAVSVLVVTVLVVIVLVSCATPTPEVVEVTKEVKEVVTQIVKETVVVAGTPKVVEKVVTPTPEPMTFKESPMLTEMVNAGELRPLEERLPNDPLVIEAPGGQIGTYGGTMNAWSFAKMTIHMIWRYERLVGLSPLYGPDRTYVYEPMIADWWEVSDDEREFTFHIREGIKWSDGEPLTTEDMRFFWEDVMQYKDLGSVLGIRVFDGEIEVIDDFTFKIIFPERNGLFLFDHASGLYGEPRFLEFPAHYLKQFHPEYVSKDEMDALLREYNSDTYDLLFRDRSNWMIHPELPVITMWALEREVDETGTSFWKRNPYYYRVDVEGNQLPYIDYVNGLTWDYDVALLKQIQGEMDYSYRQWRVNAYPFLKQGEYKGRYLCDNEVNPKAAQLTLFINMTTEDEVLREIFEDIRFRKAVSHAINRQEIVDLAWNGLGEASGLTVGKYVAFWRPEWKDMYAEYDPDLSNELLDEVGLKWDANHQYRLRPDGKTLEVIYSGREYFGQNADTHALFVEHIEAVGIKVIWKQQEGASHSQWQQTDQAQWSTDSVDLNESSSSHLTSGSTRVFGRQWYLWYASDGDEGWDPPEWVKEMFELRDKGLEAATMEERNAAYGEAVDICVRNLCMITIAGHDVRPSCTHERLVNVPRGTMMQGVNPQLAPYPARQTAPETWYLDLDWTP